MWTRDGVTMRLILSLLDSLPFGLLRLFPGMLRLTKPVSHS